MLDAIFNFQILFFLGLLVYAMYTRSAAVFALVGVFSILTGVILVTEGIDYTTGWDVSGTAADANNMYLREHYTTLTAADDSFVNMWHYVLLYGGFVWFIVAFVLAIRGRTAGSVLHER